MPFGTITFRVDDHIDAVGTIPPNWFNENTLCCCAIPLSVDHSYISFSLLNTFIQLRGSAWVANIVGDIVLRSYLYYDIAGSIWTTMVSHVFVATLIDSHPIVEESCILWLSEDHSLPLSLGMFTAAPRIIDLRHGINMTIDIWFPSLSILISDVRQPSVECTDKAIAPRPLPQGIHWWTSSLGHRPSWPLDLHTKNSRINYYCCTTLCSLDGSEYTFLNRHSAMFSKSCNIWNHMSLSLLG